MLRFFMPFLLVCTGISFALQSRAEESQLISREYQLKTAYLFHFAELTEWPTSSSVSICLQGNSPIRTYLPILDGQHINDAQVRIKVDFPVAVAECQIIFLSDLQALTPSVLEQAQQNHVLLVSDAPNFAAKGGMIEFTLRDNKLKLVVNLVSVKQAGLKLSSKLLRMAEILE